MQAFLFYLHVHFHSTCFLFFLRSLLNSPKLHLFDKKLCKNCNIMNINQMYNVYIYANFVLKKRVIIISVENCCTD